MEKDAPHTKRLDYLLEGLGGCQIAGDPRQAVAGVAYHSGRVKPGDLFVAMKGLRTDGGLFIEAALAQGARVIVSEEDVSLPDAATLVRVPDARLALAHLSAAFYDHPSRELVMVGITGTNGKTTTSYLLEAILEAAGHRVGVLGTVNYRMGDETWPAAVTTPESLDLQRLLREMRNRGASHVVMEVSSHALDLKRVDRVAFDAGVFTNLSQDHLDYHRDLDDYFTAKSRLFLELLDNGTKGQSFSILNLDDLWGHDLNAQVAGPALTYGLHPESQVRPAAHTFHRHGTEARVQTPAGEMLIRARLVGPFNLSNILAACATALGLGLDPEAVAAGIAQLPGVPGRLERFGPETGPHVFVDYAHTPAALAQVLEALQGLGFGRLITVFGCGGDRDRGKRPLMGQAAAEKSHLLVVTSDNPRTEDPLKIIAEIEAGLEDLAFPRLSLAAARRGDRGYLVVADRREAIRLAVHLSRPDDAVLVAGKGHEDYQIWGEQRLPFDDRQEVREALAEYPA